MGGDSVGWKVITLAAALLTALVPAYVAYDIYSRGSIPEKSLTLTQYGPINILRDLSEIGDRVTIELDKEEKPLNNLVMMLANIKNDGRVPILPADFYEPLSVAVSTDGWRIISVEHSERFGSALEMRWERVDEQTFKAVPALINPGDTVSASIYLTAPMGPIDSQREDVKLEWDTRVINLRGIASVRNDFEGLAEVAYSPIPIHIELMGWKLPFVVIAALLFQSIYLHFLSRVRLITGFEWRSMVIILAVTFLSFAAAEASGTYLFVTFDTYYVGVNHWMNAPWIVVHGVVIVFLYIKNKKRA